ncbi:MAG TPA: DUF1214 domain-containing protein [Rhizomicrobium sp.]|nr:DUF1214 domain-containing protein [Rhizomicrobium sp.]
MKIVAVLVAGTLVGLSSTWLIVYRGEMPGGLSNGPWHTSLAVGSEQSDPYTRASVALHGLFALNREETIYFTATHDADGNRLDGACRYEITGHDPSTRWWSITAYGADDFLIANAANRYSVSQSSVVRGKDGAFRVTVGGPDAGANWIPVGAGPFSLTLRLYNPGPDAMLDPGHTTLPSLRKISCP